jgi:predicted nucleic acid-binding protein
MAEPGRGLLDTSVVVDLDLIDPASLPDESAIAAVTLAELATGPHATADEQERARRQGIFAAARAAGRSSRARTADLLIASTAAANGLPLYTRNPGDFAGLEQVVAVVAV